MKKTQLFAAAVCLAFVLAGCANSPEPTSTAAAKPTATDTATKTKTPTPTPKPVAQPYAFHLTCHDAAYKAYEYNDYHAVWTTPTALIGCDAARSTGSFYTDEQNAAWTAAGYKDAGSLSTLYSLCADLQVTNYGSLPSYSANQVKELTGVFMICPDHPLAAGLQAKFGEVQARDAERAAGTRIGPGVRQIGVSMQPGTWVAEGQISDCYWEMLDSAGNTIDNNFLGQALRVEVSIPADVFSFSSTGCGEWTFAG